MLFTSSCCLGPKAANIMSSFPKITLLKQFPFQIPANLQIFSVAKRHVITSSPQAQLVPLRQRHKLGDLLSVNKFEDSTQSTVSFSYHPENRSGPVPHFCSRHVTTVDQFINIFRFQRINSIRISLQEIISILRNCLLFSLPSYWTYQIFE